jgi:hypothetical protein
MERNTFIEILERKNAIQELETTALKTIVDRFPYFQTARVLYLKGLKNQHSFKYNNELKITAAFTTDRTILFNYIAALDTIAREKNQAQEPIIVNNTSGSERNEETYSSNEIGSVKESLNIDKPLSFGTTEGHSFNQWLQLSSRKAIIRKNDYKTNQQKITKKDLIDTFIQNNPKIAPLDKGKSFITAVPANKQDHSLMTQTLAKVYLAQKKYENAIQAYRILSLKYPEKSGFFADQIKRIQILQKNK